MAGNVAKILACALHQVSETCAIRLVSIEGGSAHNAIARDAAAVFAYDPTESEKLTEIIAVLERSVKIEYEAIETSKV